MLARLSLSFECGETHWARPAFDALRRWVRKSLIGSVMDGCFGCWPVGSYPTSGGKVVYQEDLVTPGILPASASSRRAMRETPKRRWKPRGRPLSEQRLRMRTLEELRGSLASFFWAAKNSSSVVAGLARTALSSARLAACFSTRRMRFLLRSMAEVFGMALKW